MVSKKFLALVFPWMLVLLPAFAQETGSPARLNGRIFADGRPVDWMIEVRLEREDTSLAALAHTSGSYEFSFFFTPFQPTQHYYLVVREPGYKDLRYQLDYDNFHADTFSNVYSYSGYATLELESLPPADSANISGSKSVDIRQLGASMPAEASKEYNLAIKAFAAGDSTSGRSHLEKVVELAPQYFPAINRLGTEYLKTGQYEKAEAMLIRARDLKSNDPGTLTNLGTLYYQKGEKLESENKSGGGANAGETTYQKAAEMFEAALMLAPQAPRISYYLGTTLYKIQKYERAEQLLKNALDMDSQLQESRFTLVNIYVQQKRYNAALAQIEAYLQAIPGSPKRAEIEEIRRQIEDKILE